MHHLWHIRITSIWYIEDFQSETALWVPDLPFIFYIILGKSPHFRVLIHHLSNSKSSIYNVNLGGSFHENKYKAFHEMPGKCKTVNSLASPLSYYLLYISWNRNHLFLYCILRAWHITCNQYLFVEKNWWIFELTKWTSQLTND